MEYFVGFFIAALVGALWAYDGWNNVGMVASEVKNPQRNLRHFQRGPRNGGAAPAARSASDSDACAISTRASAPYQGMKSPNAASSLQTALSRSSS